MREKWFAAIPQQLLTSNGTSGGRLTVGDAAAFKVKQEVLLRSNTQPGLDLEIKRVIYPDVIYVGRKNSSIDSFLDISAYLTADAATIQAPEQKRPLIPQEAIGRNTYEDEPVVARRSFLVDNFGRGFSTDNPIPVRLSDGSINIGAIQANLEVQLSAQDNVPVPGRVHDSIRIGDGTNELAVGSNGEITTVSFLNAFPTLSIFDEQAVNPGIEAAVFTYTAPATDDLLLSLVEFGGDNIARYEFFVDGTIEARKYTYFSGPLHDMFDFRGSYRVPAGKVAQLRVFNDRPDPGTFYGRVLGNLIPI